MDKSFILTISMILSLMVFTACVSQSDYDKIAAELEATGTQLAAVQDQLEAEKAELAALMDKYPLRNFQSVEEAAKWAQEHKRPLLEPNVVDQGYAICMEIQREAEEDGYRVWINFDENETHTGGMLVLWTFIDGRLYFWGYSEPTLYEVATIVPALPSSD